MSNYNEDFLLEDVKNTLEEIERKYSLEHDNTDPSASGDSSCNSYNTDDKELLKILSKEFDILGLPPLKLGCTPEITLKNLLNITHLLLKLHQRTVSRMKDETMDKRKQESINTNLYKNIGGISAKLSKTERENEQLKYEIKKLKTKCESFKENETQLKREIEKLKKVHRIDENRMQHNLKKIELEKHDLENICHKGVFKTQDQAIIDLLQKYQKNEEMFKSLSIKQQDKINCLIEEIADLQEQILMSSKDENRT